MLKCICKETFYSMKNGSFIQIVKPKRSSAGEWINKREHPDNEILFTTKKKWVVKPWKDTGETNTYY